MARLLVISGVPASGKSTYCRWLTDQGWAFVNHDDLTADPIDQLWTSCLLSGRAGDFVNATTEGPRDVVLEYGFPLAWLPAVRQLKAAGADHWWFEGDHDRARADFIARNAEWRRTGAHPQIPIQALEFYLAGLVEHRNEIRDLFDPKIIETLTPAGERLTVEAIHARITARPTLS